MKEFKQLLKTLGMSRKDFAAQIGVSYQSINVMLSEGKAVPKWAKSALLVAERLKNNK